MFPPFPFVLSFRTNLELELVHRGGNLCSGGASAAAKRSCLSEWTYFILLFTFQRLLLCIVSSIKL